MPEPYDDWIDVGLVGEHRGLDALPLTDAEKRAERKRRNEAIARKIPLGFRHECAVHDPTAGAFPTVPRFDLPPRGRPIERLGWQQTIDGGEIPHRDVR